MLTGIDPTMLSATFAALADPTRRALLEQLAKGEATVGELAAPLQMSLPAVSKHLKVLERAGLLQRRREGRQHIMNFDGSTLANAAEWLEYYRQFWEGNFDRLAAYLEQEENKK
jgi:DNA-binding transcriptional ArsR family regulator